MALQSLFSWFMPKPPATYSEQQSDQFSTKLKQLAATPKGLQLRDLILKHKAEIEQALNAGYSYDDIVNVLADLNIPIKVNTLKQYLRDSSDASTKSESASKRTKKLPVAGEPKAKAEPTTDNKPGSYNPSDAETQPTVESKNSDDDIANQFFLRPKKKEIN